MAEQQSTPASTPQDDIELIEPALQGTGEEEPPAIAEPAKVMRIGAMIRTLLDEVREADLDEASRDRMREIYEQSVAELSEALSPDLKDELARLALPFSSESPSEAELRVAQAQLVGWLEFFLLVFQDAVEEQLMMGQRQLMEMRQGALPPGVGDIAGAEAGQQESHPGGVYL